MKQFCYLNNSLIYVECNEEGDVYDYDDISNAFAKCLKDLKQSYNLSGNLLATLLDIPQQTLNLYENNKRTPNFITAMKISSAFGLNIETMIIYGLDLIDIDLKQISHFPKLDGYC